LTAAIFLLTACEATANPVVSFERVFDEVALEQPVWLEQHPTDDGLWYAIEQEGRIVSWRADTQKKRVVLDLVKSVKDGGERGLLGMAFHPEFPKKPYVYVNYTFQGKELVTRIARFTTKDGGKTFDPGSQKILLTYAQPYANHNGGQVSFGPDGKLYIGTGDGGAGGDPKNHGQNPKTLLGAILRIDVDAGDPYGVPADNPFASGDKGAPEVWAYGLRNPWRFSFDGDTIWAGDVGQNAWEEIDVVRRGGNYGWNVWEGKHCYKGDSCSSEGYVMPVLEYSHDVGQSVTGGYVYRGEKVAKLRGHYIYGDFVSGRVWGWDIAKAKNKLLAKTSYNIASFAQDRAGELYVIDYSGRIFRIVPKV
jgi:glucose/arabinose dehydrogenase